MKLIMFVPAIKLSAIGRMASLVTHELSAQGHEVSIVRTECPNLLNTATHDFGVPVIPWNVSDQVWRVIEITDILIYQIGNNYEFHQGALPWLWKLPGIVCLHDFLLAHLFHGWACNGGRMDNRHSRAKTILQTWYGSKNAERFFQYTNTEAFIEGTLDTSPMIEWICSMALGVITHSRWGCPRILDSCPGPVRVVPLAYNRHNVSSMIDPSAHTSKDTFRILTIGHVNPNKRVESVIRAIGNSPILRRNSEFRLVGKIGPETEKQLYALATETGVRLLISGEVDDPTLVQAIEESDVMCCLRWPSCEAASASTIEAMLNGKPAIVINTGFYQDIPDGYALKINPKNEIPEIQAALELLYNNPDQRHAIAESGKNWATTRFTAENYARELVDMVPAVMKARPILQAIDYFSSVMQGWGAHPDVFQEDEMISRLKIFGSSDT